MKKLINGIKSIFKHKCNFNKPIASQYVSFNTRNIVYECKCGKRKVFRIYMPFDKPFPIETTLFLSDSDLDKIINKQK